jgi:hypothetical protein
LVHLDDLGSFPIFIKEDRKGYLLVLDEGVCIPFATGAKRRDVSTGCQDLLVALTNLTGPFPARQSAKMTQKEEHMALIDPQVTEAMWNTFGIRQRDFGEFSQGRHVHGSLRPFIHYPAAEGRAHPRECLRNLCAVFCSPILPPA